jgi:hypothetical protein
MRDVGARDAVQGSAVRTGVRGLQIGYSEPGDGDNKVGIEADVLCYD